MEKNKKVTTTNHNISRIKQIDNMIVICFLLMVLVVPLIVRLHTINFVSPKIIDLPGLQTGTQYDIFTAYKFFFLLAFTSIASVLFLIKIFVYKYEIKKTKMNLFLMLFILVLLLSTSLSSYKYIALFGHFNRHEGVLTFLCYTFIVFIVTNISLSRKTILLFIYMVSPFILINSVISLLNFYGYNLLESHFIQRLIYSNNADLFSFTDDTRLTDTLFHVDYLSGISSLFICLFFILSIFEKRRNLKIVNILLFFISVSALLSSLARSGFITIVILLPVVLIILLLTKEHKKILLGVTLLIFCSSIYLPLLHHNESVLSETFGNKVHSIHVEKAENGPIHPSTHTISAVKTEKKLTHPSTTNNNVISSSNFELPKLPDKGLAWGSGRGYIWENTLPIVLKHPFLGYGLDTFPYQFPQMKPEILSGLGEMNIIGFPHSLYLDIAYGTGTIGLILFLLIIGTPIIKTSIVLLKNKNKFLESNYQLLAILFVLIAYLVQGLVNDSNIGTDIIFFIFLGVLNSIGLNKETTT